MNRYCLLLVACQNIPNFVLITLNNNVSTTISEIRTDILPAYYYAFRNDDERRAKQQFNVIADNHNINKSKYFFNVIWVYSLSKLKVFLKHYFKKTTQQNCRPTTLVWRTYVTDLIIWLTRIKGIGLHLPKINVGCLIIGHERRNFSKLDPAYYVSIWVKCDTNPF